MTVFNGIVLNRIENFECVSIKEVFSFQWMLNKSFSTNSLMIAPSNMDGHIGLSSTEASI